MSQHLGSLYWGTDASLDMSNTLSIEEPDRENSKKQKSSYS